MLYTLCNGPLHSSLKILLQLCLKWEKSSSKRENQLTETVCFKRFFNKIKIKV